MNDHGIEHMLERMRPARPSAALKARLKAAIGDTDGRRDLAPVHRRRGFVIPAGIAAAVVAVGLLPDRSIPDAVVGSPPPAADRVARPGPLVEVFAPVESRSHLIHAEPGATIHRSDGPPFRLMRLLWVDEVLCRSEDRTAALEVTEAREEWVPVSAVVY